MAMDAFTIALSKVTVDQWREADYALALYNGNAEAARILDWIDMQGEKVKDYYHNLRRSYTIHKSAALTHAQFNPKP